MHVKDTTLFMGTTHRKEEYSGISLRQTYHKEDTSHKADNISSTGGLYLRSNSHN